MSCKTRDIMARTTLDDLWVTQTHFLITDPCFLHWVAIFLACLCEKVSCKHSSWQFHFWTFWNSLRSLNLLLKCWTLPKSCYVYKYMCVCVCVYTYIYILYIYIYIYVCVCVCVCVYVAFFAGFSWLDHVFHCFSETLRLFVLWNFGLYCER